MSSPSPKSCSNSRHHEIGQDEGRVCRGHWLDVRYEHGLYQPTRLWLTMLRGRYPSDTLYMKIHALWDGYLHVYSNYS
jgi:hypothetical protein